MDVTIKACALFVALTFATACTETIPEAEQFASAGDASGGDASGGDASAGDA